MLPSHSCGGSLQNLHLKCCTVQRRRLLTIRVDSASSAVWLAKRWDLVSLRNVKVRSRPESLVADCSMTVSRGTFGCHADTHTASRHRSSMSSAFRLGIVTDCDCPPYAAVDRRWPSFSGRRSSYLEQSSAARHVSTVTGHLSQSPQDSSL